MESILVCSKSNISSAWQRWSQGPQKATSPVTILLKQMYIQCTCIRKCGKTNFKILLKIWKSIHIRVQKYPTPSLYTQPKKLGAVHAKQPICTTRNSRTNFWQRFMCQRRKKTELFWVYTQSKWKGVKMKVCIFSGDINCVSLTIFARYNVISVSDILVCCTFPRVYLHHRL